ncbi:hypothetical protein DFH09DRAFT_1453826 [Mycena vulgaris]|nr:hypothetical protein DFH09DRAFT_1453826 [Mycena vulgaris]
MGWDVDLLSALGSWVLGAVWAAECSMLDAVVEIYDIHISSRGLDKYNNTWREEGGGMRTASRTSRADVGRSSDDGDGTWDRRRELVSDVGECRRGCGRSWGKVGSAARKGYLPHMEVIAYSNFHPNCPASAGCLDIEVRGYWVGVPSLAKWIREAKGRE